MAPSFEGATSILLCAEDNSDLDAGIDEISWAIGLPPHGDAYLGALLVDFPLQSEDCIEALIKREEQQLPMEGYSHRLLQHPEGLDLLGVRSEAIEWIWEVHQHYKFGPLTAVLSVNYLDRFLSVYDLPQGNAWMTQLLAVACLSLAAKMEETVVPHPLDLQVGEAKYVFEPRTVKRMELLVLSALKWRMQAVTACSFVDYYLHKFSDGDEQSIRILSRSADLILSTSKVAELLVFRPSEIAASVALVALGEHGSSILKRVANCCQHLKKERVLGCYEAIQDKVAMGSIVLKSDGSSVFSVPQSLMDVLDASACMSQQREGITVGSPATYCENSSASKRRRICR